MVNHRRIILIAVLVAAIHLMLTSVLGYYLAHEVGGSAGRNIARTLIDAHESNTSASEVEAVERYGEMKKTIDATVDRWRLVSFLASLPVGFAIDAMAKPVTRYWFAQALAHELSLPQWRVRMYALVAAEFLLNSGVLGLLVYLALRVVTRFHAP